VNKRKERDNYYEKSEVVRLGRGWCEQHQQIDNNFLVVTKAKSLWLANNRKQSITFHLQINLFSLCKTSHTRNDERKFLCCKIPFALEKISHISKIF
jgi:hypothetical protein